MGFAWISPIYLAGVLLLALPVLIHLVQKHHPSGIRFPSLMFLRQIPFRQKRRLQIRHWLLLLLRCLLLLLLVIAFARPFLSNPDAASALDRERSDSVIVLDRSYSMRIADRWQQARQKALDIIAAASARDRIGIVLFDDETEVASDLSADSVNLRALIGQLDPGFRATRLRVAVEQAARLLESSDAARKRIFLISDFQSAPARTPQITADIELVAQPVETAPAANAAITGFAIGPSARAAADEFSLRIDIANYAPQPLEQTLSLALNGREVGRRSLILEPGATQSAGFDGLVVTGDLARAEIRLGDDALAVDNAAYFVFSSRQQVPVLLIEEPGARPNQTVYVAQALGLSHRPGYRVRQASWEQLEPRDLASWAIIIVNDVALPGGEMGEALRNFVAAGGGLLVATGDRLRGGWPGAADGFLPGSLQRQVESNPGRAYRIGAVAGDHPLAGLDLGRARVFSYRGLDPGPSDRVLARYQNGAAALLERKFGDGRVIALTTTLDTHWNDLALRPNFLPFVLQSMAYLSAFEAYPDSVEIGAVVDVMRYARALAGVDAIVAAADDSLLTIETPEAREIRLERSAPLLPIREPGFYQIHRATPAGVEVVVAANLDPVESAPGKIDIAQFVADVRAAALPAAADLMTRRQAAQREQRQQLWYVILALALVLALIEAFAANWASVRKSGDSAAKPV